MTILGKRKERPRGNLHLLREDLPAADGKDERLAFGFDHPTELVDCGILAIAPDGHRLAVHRRDANRRGKHPFQDQVRRCAGWFRRPWPLP